MINGFQGETERGIVMCDTNQNITILSIYRDANNICTITEIERSGFVQCNSVDGLFICFLDSLSLLYSSTFKQ